MPFRCVVNWLCLGAAVFLSACASAPLHRPPVSTLCKMETTPIWTARDGTQLPYQQWPGSPADPRAVVLCVHGLSGAAKDFWPVGESFPQKGYAVYGMQLRGQGNDPDAARRGDIRRARQWQEDLLDFTAFIRARHPGVPLYWFGESLGALITINTAGSLGDKLDETVAGIILTSPVVALRENLQLSFLKNLALRTLMLMWPGKRISLEKLGNIAVQVTSETTHREQMQHTPHYVKDFTLRLFGQIEKLIKTCSESSARIRVPILVFYTPNDVLTSKEGVERFFQQLASPDKTPVYFPKSYHLILHDRDRAAALEKLGEWLDQRTRSRP